MCRLASPTLRPLDSLSPPPAPWKEPFAPEDRVVQTRLFPRISPGSPGPPPPEPLPGSLGRGSPHSPHQRAQAVPRRLHGRAAAGPPRQRDLSGAGGAAPPRGGPSPPLPPPRPCLGGVRGKGGGGGFSPTICPGEEREGFCSARIGVTYYLLASYKPI